MEMLFVVIEWIERRWIDRLFLISIIIGVFIALFGDDSIPFTSSIGDVWVGILYKILAVLVDTVIGQMYETVEIVLWIGIVSYIERTRAKGKLE